ncbi:unnamed protein product [Haemonchus placei]|uniref:Uncharacterized protein n=1 Tax=Haemonchus placei TaxID=6290 RepID=A0A0N4WR99_HAEPC|nr:unnamed protein product [Haemonchus placei]
MVELGSKSPYGQSFDNSVFIIPAIVILAIVGWFCFYLLYNKFLYFEFLSHHF